MAQRKNKDYPINALPKKYVLNSYIIKRVLGVGGFGITYLAEDKRLNILAAIKEYMPSEMAIRGSGNGKKSFKLHPKSSQDAKDFRWGLERFIDEARTIANASHPNIVQVKHFFEANNTAYIVMPYVKGCSLSELLKNGDTATEEEIKSIIIPLLDGLKEDVHKRGILHCDIKPSNIYIHDKDNTPILIDFGAARYGLGSHSRTVTSIISPGYSPYEQYQTHGNLGVWTDIYSMGAVMYRLISGDIPIESSARVIDDPLKPAVEVGKGEYSYKLLAAIDHALAVREKGRPQSVADWLSEINDDEPKFKKEGDDKNDHFPPSSHAKFIYIYAFIFIVIGTLVWNVLPSWLDNVTLHKEELPTLEPEVEPVINPELVPLINIEPQTQINIRWQDTLEIERNKKAWEAANQYCKNLTLDGLSWELPDRSDFRDYKQEFKFKSIAGKYWAKEIKGMVKAGMYDQNNGTTGKAKKDRVFTVRCISKRS